MSNVNSKVQNRFNKKFDTDFYFKDLKYKYPYLFEKILSELQEMYDLGHADGYAEAIMNNMT